MPSRDVMSLSVPAVSICKCSDSTTQGPAIRNSGRSRPTSKPHSFMRTPRGPASCRDFLGEPRRGTHRLVFARGAYETHEQRMAVARRRGEFRMELASHEPRMLVLGQLDHLDEQIVHRLAGDDESQV